MLETFALGAACCVALLCVLVLLACLAAIILLGLATVAGVKVRMEWKEKDASDYEMP